MKNYAPFNVAPHKFKVNDAVMYEGRMGRVEDAAVDTNRKNIYLVEMSNHLYHWIPEELLEAYIG
jgi:hypothetical protein